jgi:hypothetical protein
VERLLIFSLFIGLAIVVVSHGRRGRPHSADERLSTHRLITWGSRPRRKPKCSTPPVGVSAGRCGRVRNGLNLAPQVN